MTAKDKIFQGLGVSPGIAIGIAHVRESGSIAVPEYPVPESKVDEERIRLGNASARARRQIGRLRAKVKAMPGAAGVELGYLLDAYIQMLKDSRLLRGAARRIGEDHINAEAAVMAEIAEISAGFADVDDAYLAARLDDIRAVGNRLIENLTKAPVAQYSRIPDGGVVIAEELTPADTAQLDPRNVVGFATVFGGAQGHTAIMANALGLPAVMGAPGLLRGAKSGAQVIIDGDTGRVIVDPTPETVAEYGRRREQRQRETRRLAGLRKQPAMTRDGIEIELQANVELPIEMDMVVESGAAGIGLLRTEFMFMNRDDAPGEEEQYESLRGMMGRLGRRSVTVRTLDIGGEKTSAAVTGGMGDSVTSALGLRGIRLSLARPDVFETQLKAILRAAAHGPVRILLPMVTNASEVRRAREVMIRAARRLKRRGAKIPDALPPLGVMIEVPGAALSADALARESDFFAIGSNDLTMYTLAIDRSDEQVAHLYDSMHPAVLRLIQFSAEAAMRARIPVSICGEIAGDQRYTALLLGLGYRELSMTAANIPRVKKRIRSMDLAAADRRARVIMDQVDTGRIATLLDDFNGLA